METKIKKKQIQTIFILVFMGIGLLLMVRCVQLNNQVKLYEAENNRLKANQMIQMMSRMRIQAWICNDYADLMDDIVHGQQDIAVLCSYANAIGNFTRPDLFNGTYELEVEDDKDLLEFVRRLMNGVNLSEMKLRNASLVELEALGKNFDRLAMLLHDDNETGALPAYLWSRLYDVPIEVQEGDELAVLVHEITQILAEIETYSTMAKE